MKTKMDTNPAELLGQATHTYFGAIRNGLQLQEEVATQWSELFRRSEGPQFVPQAFQQAVKEMLPLVQRQTDDALKLIENGTRQSLDLISQAVSTGQAETAIDMQTRVEKLWSAYLRVLRDNSEAMVETNARLLELWAHAAKKNIENVAANSARATASAARASAKAA